MQPSSPPYLRAISILHLALLVGQLILAGIFLLSVHFEAGHPEKWQSLSQTLLIVCIALGVIAFVAGNFLFKKRLGVINAAGTGVAQKLDKYRAASILRWALIEAATLFTIIIFFLTQNYYTIIAAFILMEWIIMYFR